MNILLHIHLWFLDVSCHIHSYTISTCLHHSLWISLVPNSRPNSLGEWVCSWTSLLWHKRWPYGTDTQSFTVLSGFAREVWKNITLLIHKEGPSKICFPVDFGSGLDCAVCHCHFQQRIGLSVPARSTGLLNSASLGPFLSACASTVLVTAQICTVHWLLLLRAFGSFCACVCPTQWWQWVCQQFGVHSTPQKGPQKLTKLS